MPWDSITFTDYPLHCTCHPTTGGKRRRSRGPVRFYGRPHAVLRGRLLARRRHDPRLQPRRGASHDCGKGGSAHPGKCGWKALLPLRVARRAPYTVASAWPVPGTSGAGAYGEFTAQVGGAVGMILGALDNEELRGKALVVFTSDNGAFWGPEEIGRYGHRSNHHWRGMKADVLGGVHRVPLIVRWPARIASGVVTDQLTVLTHLMATFAGIGGVPLPENAAEDSYSLYGLLTGATGISGRGEAMHHASEGMLALRQGPCKFIDGQGSGGFTPVDVKDTDPAVQPGRRSGQDPEPRPDAFRKGARAA